MGSLAFSKLLLHDAKVAVSPGIGFGEYGDEHVRFAWQVSKDGATLSTGTNVATLAPDGRFQTVAGFTDPK